MALDKEGMRRRIRSYMVDAGMNYESLAETLGEKPGTVKSWVYGQRELTLENAARICDVFGKSLDDLACRETKEA